MDLSGFATKDKNRPYIGGFLVHIDLKWTWIFIGRLLFWEILKFQIHR